MLKKYKIVALLLSISLIIGLAGCGKSKTSKGKGKKSEVAQSAPNALPNNVSANPSLTAVSFTEQEDIPIELRILPSQEFGRDNPFIPLTTSSAKIVQAAQAKIMSNYIDRSEEKYLPPIMPNASVKKQEPLPDVRLSLVIDGSTAIFEENRASKVLSVGETVGGMKIQEIKRDGVILINGEKKYTVSPGGRLAEISSPTQSQQKPVANPSKSAKQPVKAKKK